MDENQAAYLMVERSTADPEPSPRRRSTPKPPKATKAEISRVMAAMGRKGGGGGKRRLETMTPEQRKAIAQQAARTRWAKVKNSV